MYTSIALAALAASASAFDCSGAYFSFYNRGGQAMSYQRLDPALYPGVESPHLHSFDGGNALAASMGFDSTQSASCTSARIKPDKSLYWRPTLYWNGNNTGFYRVPDKFLKIYYKFGDAGNVRANVTEFPENFNMIAGKPSKRSDDGNNPGGIKWSCMQDASNRIDTVGFPKGFTSCNDFATEITFPACWNGKDLDPKKPSAHMAYPTAGGNGLDACPDGFKVARFPTIFIEFWYDIKPFEGYYTADSNPWVLSNGDPTGYGFHADFLNGWEKGVLAKATAETGYCNCGCGCGNDQMKQCFGADQVNDDSDADFKSCAASPEYGGDDSTPIDKLPGCNPIQSGPADATQVTGEGCAATPASGGDKTSAASANPSPTAKSVSSADSSVASSAASSKATSADALDVSSAYPSLTIGFPNKQPEPTGGDGYGAPTPTLQTSALESAASSSQYTPPAFTPSFISDGGTLGLVFTDIATNPPTSVASPTDGLPPFSVATSANLAETTGLVEGGEGGCKAPVYITITPTVYVTADMAGNTTSCAPTVYETFTNTATVTVPAGGHKHKRHADLHKH